MCFGLVDEGIEILCWVELFDDEKGCMCILFLEWIFFIFIFLVVDLFYFFLYICGLLINLVVMLVNFIIGVE